MVRKMTATMLIATALPFSKVYAHPPDKKGVPVEGYLYFMIAIGALYALFLLFRLQRRKTNDNKS